MSSLAEQTRFPFRLHLEQSRITPVMLYRLSALPNARVRFGQEVRGVAQDDSGISVTIAGGNGEETIRTRHVIAADGAHSAVRQALGIGFVGFAYPDKILRVFTTDDLDRILPGIAPVTYVYNGARSVRVRSDHE